MPTPVSFSKRVRSGQVQQVLNVTKADGSGAFTQYVALDPTMETVVAILKGGNSVTVEATNQVNVTDIENATVWVQLNSGTASYIAGDQAGLTGLKITATPVGGAVSISVVQMKCD